MTPEQLVRDVSPVLAAVGAVHYFHPVTRDRGSELGLDAFRFYFAGRGGVLGDVEPSVVASAFGYFEPRLVAKMWSSAMTKVAPRQAAREQLACAHQIARDALGGVEGLDAFCAAAEAVVAATDPAALALFAGFAAEPLPDDLPARALQLAITLREQRGSAHLVAVVAAGLDPRIAHQIRRPDMVQGFGWAEPAPETDQDRAKLAQADELTDRIVLPSFSALDAAQADALLSGAKALHTALLPPA